MTSNRSKIEQEIETTRLLTEDPRVTNCLSEIAEETAKDDVLQFYSSKVINHISEGWKTNKRHIPIQILPFWSVEDELLLSDGIVYRGDCLVIPATLLKSPTATLYQAYMGIQSTLRRTRTSVWWPGMNVQLKQFIASCEVCNTFQTKNRRKLLSHEIPNRPWSKVNVASDIFEWNKEHFLVLVDYYSDWIEFDLMNN